MNIYIYNYILYSITYLYSLKQKKNIHIHRQMYKNLIHEISFQ